MELKKSNTVQNSYILTGTRYGKHPKYLRIIDYVYTSEKEYFTKEELLVNSGYLSRARHDYGGYMSYLFSQFNHNGIIIYDNSIKKWKKGPNFMLWILDYYKELVEQNSKETYESEFLTKKYGNKEEKFNMPIKVAESAKEEKAQLMEALFDFIFGSEEENDKKNLINEKLNQIEKLIKEVRELL